MGQQYVTIKDVAKVAGVSPATVSLVLSGDSRIKEETKAAVISAAQKLNYVPNEIGRSLRSRKTETIALIVPNTPLHVFTHQYFSNLLEGISEVLDECNYNLLLSTTSSEKNEDDAYNRILRNRRVDGIILTSASIKDRNILRMVESGFPTVYLGKWHHNEIYTVERDDVDGAILATNHLIKLGRRKIVHIAGPLDHQESLDRLEGYKKALSDNKLLFDENLVIEKNLSRAAGYEAVEELIKKNVEFDAVFASNDLMAIGVIQYLNHHKIQVPGQVAVVGFDDIEMDTVIVPSLTTIKQPMRLIGNLAAKKLLKVLSGQKIDEKRTIVPTELIIRESCGAKAQNQQLNHHDVPV